MVIMRSLLIQIFLNEACDDLICERCGLNSVYTATGICHASYVYSVETPELI